MGEGSPRVLSTWAIPADQVAPAPAAAAPTPAQALLSNRSVAANPDLLRVSPPGTAPVMKAPEPVPPEAAEAAEDPGLVDVHVEVGGGVSGGDESSPGWVVEASANAQLAPPILSVLHPTLGVGLTLMGYPETSDPAGGTEGGRTELVPSLRMGLRLETRETDGYGIPRPEGFVVALEGGPATFVGRDARGVMVGLAAGMRWHVMDVTMGATLVSATGRDDLDALNFTLNVGMNLTD